MGVGWWRRRDLLVPILVWESGVAAGGASYTLGGGEGVPV